MYIINRYAEICPDMCRYAQTCKIYADTPRYGQIRPDTSRYAKYKLIRPDTSRYIHICRI